MGRAVDTVGLFNTQAGAGAFPLTLAPMAGDSLTVRGAVAETKVRLMAALYQSNAAGQRFRITSPLMHDNVTGFTVVPGENPLGFAVPQESGLELDQQDTLLVQGACGAATTVTAALVIDYDNLRGTSAELFRWHDIRDDIKDIKSIEVGNLAIAVGAWTDTPLTNTEDQLHADKSYAVLGYTCAANVLAVGVKGVATGNLRMCGPGFATTLDVADYFIQMSEDHQRPYIPVVQANDRRGITVSQINGTAVGANAATVSLIVAELKTKR